jgi:hypothetical protein
MRSILRTQVACGALLAVVFARPCAAYVDPAAGSMMLQLVLGGAAGVAIAAKLLWRRVVALLQRTPAPPGDHRG